MTPPNDRLESLIEEIEGYLAERLRPKQSGEGHWAECIEYIFQSLRTIERETAEKERKRCAAIADKMLWSYESRYKDFTDAKECATTIRNLILSDKEAAVRKEEGK